jgi:hypothetical protein
MGAVYEAEQVSLGRRVALKAPPFAATMDPRQLQRFHNEARAAAALDHQHIIPVHAVGCERGVHYYAMQYIDGHTLAALIASLAQAGGRPAAPEAEATGPHVSAAGAGTCGPAGGGLDGAAAAGSGAVPAGGRGGRPGGSGAGPRAPAGHRAPGRQAGQPAGGRWLPAQGKRPTCPDLSPNQP